MKKVLLSLFCLSTAFALASGEEGYVDSEFYTGGKSAVVMTYFGTTHPDTRAKTIDAINQRAKEAFKGEADVFEAYTSRIVTRRVEKNEGLKKYNPSEVLTALKKKGYKNIIIQPTNTIDGIEMKTMEAETMKFKKDFNHLRIGQPLLCTPENYKEVINIISKTVGPLKKNEGIVLVGHGTPDPGTASYAMFDYMAKDMNKPIYVGTIEGYPTFDTMVKQLKRDKKNEVVLMPMMFVAGDHAHNDIAIDWKNNLQKAGFKVNVKLLPFGQIPQIQDMFIESAKFMEHHKKVDMMAKKAELKTEKD